jgi:hypothetical protein
MEEIVVTRLWMAGVVGMMVIFAIIAVIGYVRKKPGDSSEGSQDQQAPGS